MVAYVIDAGVQTSFCKFISIQSVEWSRA
jgi:hypothetical protein